MNPVRTALICDFVEENWPSMDLVGDMLTREIQQRHSRTFELDQLRPAMRRRFSTMPLINKRAVAFNADRLANRFLDYPKWLSNQRDRFDLFHVVDHTYAHLVEQLPQGRTIVTCHDLDAFRCLLEPAREPRPFWFRAFTKRILAGFQKAAHVICVTDAIREALLAYAWFEPEQVTTILNGVHPSCSPEKHPEHDREAELLLGSRAGDPYLLHVGLPVQRKRIDVLLEVFAFVRSQIPEVRLVRVGGPFTAAQNEMLKRLRIQDAVQVMPFLDRGVLAAVYRKAALVLQPSEAEGFGLPVIEAMACGCPVVASDLAVLREVAGLAASYCAVADVPSWADTVMALLKERNTCPGAWLRRTEGCIAHAANFSWAEAARKTVAVYGRVSERNRSSRLGAARVFSNDSPQLRQAS